jgi:hypothetical protein
MLAYEKKKHWQQKATHRYLRWHTHTTYARESRECAEVSEVSDVGELHITADGSEPG